MAAMPGRDRAAEACRKRFEPVLDFELLDLLETGGMPLRQDPDLKRKPRSERNDREELPVFGDYSGAIPALLPDDVAVNAPLLVLVVFPAAFDFRSDVRRNNG